VAGVITRRKLIAGVAAGGSSIALSGWTGPTYNTFFQDNVLSIGEWLNYRAQRLIMADALAQEFPGSEMSPVFRTNGNTDPGTPEYQKLAADQFANWQLQIDGLVVSPKSYSLAQLQAMPSRTQITRHDCVEGWSAIGKWTGVQLGRLLKQVGLEPNARFIVFHCADQFDGTPYYESIDLVDAFHPQTLLAYAMNDQPLSIGHGAPLRLRVERQLGYKHAKYVMRVEAVALLSGIGGGLGGYWEDEADYYWYAGI
jgi:DMSO/TMAO reductase YedYZ molybdopterin-dependent catalytic subunit